MSLRASLAAIATLTLTLGLAACGGGGSGGSAAPVIFTGVLADSEIAGVPYSTTSGQSGTTNADGEFRYLAGDTVTFSVGGIPLALPAGERITPAVLAAALFDGQAIIDRATINFAILFQSLDRDGDPENGIRMPADLSLSGFDLLGALAKTPAEFVAALTPRLPGGLTPVSPAAAIAHYYRRELTGNWRAVRLREEGIDATSALADDKLGFILSFDGAAQFVYATWDRNGTTDQRSADSAYGDVLLPDSDTRLRVRLQVGAATDPGEDLDGATLVLRGNLLEVTTPSATITYQRLRGIRGSLLGSWMEPPPGAGRDRAGNPWFVLGDAPDTVFYHFIGSNRMLYVEAGEKPQLASYEASGVNLSVDEILIGNNPPDNFFVLAPLLEDTRRTLSLTGGREQRIQRLLAPVEFQEVFRHTVPYQLRQEVVAITRDDPVTEGDAVLFCNGDRESGGVEPEVVAGDVSYYEMLLTFDEEEGIMRVQAAGSDTIREIDYDPETGELSSDIDLGSNPDAIDGVIYFSQREQLFSGTYDKPSETVLGTTLETITNTWSLDASSVVCTIEYALSLTRYPQQLAD